MDNKERTFFVNQYTKLVIGAWSDDAVARRLVADPRQTAADFGLRVPDGATVTLVRQIPSEGDHTPRLDFRSNCGMSAAVPGCTNCMYRILRRSTRMNSTRPN